MNASIRRAAVAAWLTFSGLAIGQPSVPSAQSDTARHGMVAAAHPLAVQAGLEILAMGGNAVDAAAAVAFAVTVVEPFGSSIGGDGGALVYSVTDGKVRAYNYRCAAPLAANTSTVDYTRRNEWLKTARAAAVPGMVAGTCAMHEDYGLLPLATVMEPAIRYASEGYTVGRTLATVLTDMYNTLADNPDLAATYLLDDLPPDTGQTLRNPALAESLRLIAEHGPAVFYGGELGQRIATFAGEHNSLITLEDLKSYSVERADPLVIDYRGYTVFSAPPPFGGIAVLESLQLLKHLPFDAGASLHAPTNLHLLIEVMKASSADRTAVCGDPRFVSVPTRGILSDAYARRRVQEINLQQATATVTPGPVGDLHDPNGSTTHLTVVDAQGNAVSLTQTLGAFFGCGVMVPGTGIVLNDQMKNFSTRRNSPNNLQPGKRMNSTQSPTIVLRDGELVLAIGSPGEYRILTTVFLMLVNVLDFDMPLLEALDAPRLSARETLPQVAVEGRFPSATLDELRARGHQLRVYRDFDLFFGGVHAVQRDPATGILTGAADRRRDGVAGGLALTPTTR
jgi:gamma-glutamyltranspeptidase/glutathione hydrolase